MEFQVIDKKILYKMKNSLVILMMFTSLGAHAQTELIELLKLDFQRSKTQILAYIDIMPEEHFGFKPTPDTRSFAEQMLHIAQGTAGLVANGTGTEKPFSENLEKVEKYSSKGEVRRLVTESFDFALASLDNISPDNYLEPVQKGPFNVSRMGWVMKAYEHMLHHKGQSAIYLRLKGIVPPQYQLF